MRTRPWSAVGSIALLVAVGLLVGIAAGAAAGPRALMLVYCTDKPPVPHPRRCDFRVPEFSSYPVKKLNWKHWGNRRASATGIYEFTGERVRIVLSQPVKCQVGPPRAVKIYTHMVLDTKRFEPWSFSIPDCDGPR